MQSAFVDIGLERDAFLYVSDFLELTGDEDEDEEFGSIPTPRGTIEVGKPQPTQEAQPAQSQTALDGPQTEEEQETFVEDFAAPAEELSVTEEGSESSSGEESESGEGARRWRGRRRRRGGRRGRPDERESHTDAAPSTPPPAAAAPVEEAPAPPARSESRHESRSESRHESHPRSDYDPPQTRVHSDHPSPGKSMFQYRCSYFFPAAETQSTSAVEDETSATAPVAENFVVPEAVAEAQAEQQEMDDAVHLDQGFDVEPSASTEVAVVTEEEQPRSKRRGWWSSRRKNQEAKNEAAAMAPNEETQTSADDQQQPPAPPTKPDRNT